MSSRCLHQTLYHLLVSGFCFLLISGRVFAANSNGTKDCKTLPANDGPQYNISGECKDDCGCPDPSGKRFTTEIDSYAKVSCIEDPKLLAKALPPDIAAPDVANRILNHGNGQVTYDLNLIDSYGIYPATLKKFTAEQAVNLLSNLTIPERLDDNLCDSLCAYTGEYDADKCTAYLNTFDANSYPNILACSNFTSRAQSMEQRFDQQKKRMQQIMKCSDDSESNLLCDQNYTVDNKNHITALQVAETYQNYSYEQFQNLQYTDLASYKRILALRQSRASAPLCIVVTRKDKDEVLNALSKFFNINLTEDTFYLCGYVPGVPASRELSQNWFRSLTTSENGDETINNIMTDLNKPTSGTTIADRLKNKVLNAQKSDSNQAGLECASFQPNYQTMGGQGPSRNTDSKEVSWTFDIKDTTPAEIAANPDSHPMEYIYQAFVIGPTEVIAQVLGKNKNAMMKNMFSSDVVDNFSQDTQLPIPIGAKAPTASTKSVSVNVGDPKKVEVDCEKGKTPPCYDTVQPTVDAKLDFAASSNPQFGLTDKLVESVLNVAHKLAWPLISDSRYNSCYYPSLEQKMNTATFLGGSPLSTFINRVSVGQSSTCNDPTIKSSPSPHDADICAIASKYKVPCEYLKAIWFIETANATSCDVVGSQGPMAIVDGDIPYIDPNHTLNRCNLSDAYELAARTLLWKKCGQNWEKRYQLPETDSNFCSINFSTDKNTWDLISVGQYNQCNECKVSDQSQYRWGKGKSYCDAAVYLIENNYQPWPWKGDTSFNSSGVCCYDSAGTCQPN